MQLAYVYAKYHPKVGFPALPLGTGNHVLGVILRTRMQVAGIGRSRGIARGRARSGFVALGVEE